MDTAEELTKLASRIEARRADEAADRARQRFLMRRLRAEGATIDTIQAAARVSRPTVIAALRRED